MCRSSVKEVVALHHRRRAREATAIHQVGDPVSAIPIPTRCAECGRLADEDARGWRALHGREHPEDPPEVVTFCPECAEREFEARA